MRLIKKWGWEVEQKVRISFILLITIFHLPPSYICEATTWHFFMNEVISSGKGSLKNFDGSKLAFFVS